MLQINVKKSSHLSYKTMANYSPNSCQKVTLVHGRHKEQHKLHLALTFSVALALMLKDNVCFPKIKRILAFV